MSSRPALLPASRAARWALAALLVFALLRGLAFAVTIPAFWAPDEDYHFLYSEHLITQQALPDPDRPLYPREYQKLAEVTRYDDYGPGPRSTFTGDPRASLHALEDLPDSAREPTLPGRGVGVVHPPLYHLAGAVVDRATGDSAMQTRVFWVRVMTALFGVLTVYMAWLLAAQVFARFRLQILSAFVFAVQPIVAYGSGIVNHDMALVAFFTAALAMMLFIVRSPPRAAQGAWLAAPVVLALFVKGTALVLVPLAALALLAQALAWRPEWRTTARSAALSLGLVALLAGWWYVRAQIVYGSATGAASDVIGTSLDPSLGEYLQFARQWTLLTYRTYWFHFVFFETPGPSFEYFMPMAVGALGIAGLAVAAWQERQRLLDPEHPLLRQIVLMVIAAFSLYLPFLYLDVSRMAAGQPFLVNGGRYLLPAYAGVATLLVVGLRRLFRGRLEPYALVGLAVIAAVFCGRVFLQYYVRRYFGDTGVGETLRRIAFDRPAFVTPFSLGLLGLMIIGSLGAFAAAVIRANEDMVPRSDDSPEPSTA